MEWMIINNGNAPGYIWFDGTVSGTQGFLLGPGGGFASMSIDEDGEEVTRELWAVSPTGSSQMSGFEVVTK
jgi:hypothetical protein